MEDAIIIGIIYGGFALIYFIRRYFDYKETKGCAPSREWNNDYSTPYPAWNVTTTYVPREENEKRAESSK